MEVEEIKETTKDLTDHVTEYVETFYKVAVLNLTQKATDLTSTVIMVVALLTLGTFVLLFGSIALAWWLGNLLESRVAGFLIVAGFYLLLLILIIALRKNFVFPIFRNAIIRKLYV